VATVVIFGRRVLVGVILGAVLSQSIHYLNISLLTAALASLSFVLALVVGGIVQIEVAYRLIDRYVGLDNPLIELRDTLLYFLLAGPAGCLAGVLLSAFIGAIPAENILEYMWVWWQCNSLAVLIILPLIMALFRKPRNN
jgi:integral membrane sensor domain MASE1